MIVEDIREELKKLLELQEKDILIYHMEKRLREIPSEIEGLRKEIERVEGEIKSEEEKITGMEKRLKDYFFEIEDIEAMINKFEQDRLKVKTNEEYRAVEKEIQEAKKKKEKVEEDAIALMEEIEQEKENLENLKKEGENKIRGYEKKIKEIEEEARKIKDELPVRKDERLRISKRVKGRYLEIYERVRRIRGNPAVVPVKNGACGGCHAFVPTQKIDYLRKTKGIDTCEHCGRILYIPEEEL